jgi:hypothetical protein
MVEVEVVQLKEAAERMHGGSAMLAQSVAVRETFQDKPIWEGVVHVFDLAGHPTAARVCVVLADQAQFEATVLRGAASAASGQLASCGARGDYSGVSHEKFNLGGFRNPFGTE